MKTYASLKTAWNSHDAGAIAAAFHPSGVYSNPAAGSPLTGAAIAGYTQGLFTAIPDFKVDVVSVAPVNDHVLAEQWVIKGTWTKAFPGGPLAGVPPTGKSFAVPGAGFLDIKDGKIMSDTIYFDQMSFLTQIGVIQQK
jgi:steroid delta-isomerase-like uncharacterized protein